METSTYPLEYKGIENMNQEELNNFFLTDFPENSPGWEDWYGCLSFGTQEYIKIIRQEKLLLLSRKDEIEKIEGQH